MDAKRLNEWEGEERRAIPIHILNHIDSKFGELDTKLNNLTLSINSWLEKEPGAILERCENMVDECIPTSPDNPDAEPREKRKEHRHAHAKWMQEIHDEMQRWKDIRKKAIEWAVAAVLSGIVVWVMWSVQKYVDK